jgi:hypothetical protein
VGSSTGWKDAQFVVPDVIEFVTRTLPNPFGMMIYDDANDMNNEVGFND